jgi:hypothetical protein
MISPVLPSYARAKLSFVKGEGSWLVEADGRRFLDFGAGIAVMALGHATRRWCKALKDQADKLWHTSNLYTVPEQEALAERLVEAHLRRHRLLLQFRHRSRGTRHQDGAQVPLRHRRPSARRSSPSRAPSTAAPWPRSRRPGRRS